MLSAPASAIGIVAANQILAADDTRLDRFLEGNRQELTALKQQGLQVFQRGELQCTQGHQGPEFTAASIRKRGERDSQEQ